MKTRNITLILLSGLFAALTAIGAFIKIPLPYVPLTLQVFFSLLAGILLGARFGAASQIVYIIIGLAGIPIFSYGGGPAYVVNPTFGYLLGMLVCAFVIGLLSGRLNKISITGLFLINLVGVLIIYAVGVPYLYLIKNLYLNADTSFWKVLYSGFLITLPGDVIKAYLAALTGAKLIPYVKKFTVVKS